MESGARGTTRGVWILCLVTNYFILGELHGLPDDLDFGFFRWLSIGSSRGCYGLLAWLW
jgi:hypothetical protein